jgi:hypothetical protein
MAQAGLEVKIVFHSNIMSRVNLAIALVWSEDGVACCLLLSSHYRRSRDEENKDDTNRMETVPEVEGVDSASH